MTTALQIIQGSARLLGVLRKSEALSGDEAADGLVSLNDMIASWANNSLLVPSRVWESFNVSAASSYTIGTGQTLNTVRPISIKAAFIRSSNIDYPMEILTDEEYEDISLKSTTSPFPDYLTIDNAHPYGTIRMYPQLGTSAALHLLSEKALTAFAALSTDVDLPPGWRRALRFNLAVELAPEYGTEVSKEVIRGASDSLADIQLAVAKNRPLKFRPKNYNRGTIYDGYYP